MIEDKLYGDNVTLPSSEKVKCLSYWKKYNEILFWAHCLGVAALSNISPNSDSVVTCQLNLITMRGLLFE